jgi:hypothetical protein
VMGTDGLVDEVGRVHMIHGNGDVVCAPTGHGLGAHGWTDTRRSLQKKGSTPQRVSRCTVC